MTEKTLLRKDSDEDKAGEEEADEGDPNEEDSGEDILSGEESSDEGCFQDWNWRDL